MKRFAITFIGFASLLGCTSFSNVQVTPGEREWGGEFDGAVFSASAPTLTVTRAGPSPLMQEDLSFARDAARNYCESRELVFQENTVPEDGGQPSFFNNAWELAGYCTEPL